MHSGHQTQKGRETGFRQNSSLGRFETLSRNKRTNEAGARCALAERGASAPCSSLPPPRCSLPRVTFCVCGGGRCQLEGRRAARRAADPSRRGSPSSGAVNTPSGAVNTPSGVVNTPSGAVNTPSASITSLPLTAILAPQKWPHPAPPTSHSVSVGGCNTTSVTTSVDPEPSRAGVVTTPSAAGAWHPALAPAAPPAGAAPSQSSADPSVVLTPSGFSGVAPVAATSTPPAPSSHLQVPAPAHFLPSAVVAPQPTRPSGGAGGTLPLFPAEPIGGVRQVGREFRIDPMARSAPAGPRSSTRASLGLGYPESTGVPGGIDYWTAELSKARAEGAKKQLKKEGKVEMVALLAQLAEDPSSGNPLLAGPPGNPAGSPESKREPLLKPFLKQVRGSKKDGRVESSRE
eukprot:1188030-Prorocentrum_minimum.AAC.2